MLEQILENQKVILNQNTEILTRLNLMSLHLKAIGIIIEQPLNATLETRNIQEITIKRDFTHGGLTNYNPLL